MIDWQTLLSLLIVAAAAIQLVRLLCGRKSRCGSCGECSCSPENSSEPLVQLEDLGPSRKVQS